MKKQLILLLTCLIVVALLGGGLYFLMQYEPEGGESSSAAQDKTTLFEKNADQLSSVVVQNATDTFTMQKVDDSDYGIVELPGLPMSQSRLKGSINSIAPCSAVPVEENAADLAPYGLDNPQATVRAIYDGGEFTLSIGNEAPAGQGYYVKGTDNGVYALSNSSLRYFLDPLLSFVDKTITSQPDPNAAATGSLTYPSKVTLGGALRPEPLVMEMGGDNAQELQEKYGFASYMMLSPKNRPVDGNQASEKLTSLLGIAAQEVVAYQPDEAALSQYGLDEPYSTAEFTYADLEGTNHTVKLSASAPADGMVYLMREGVPLVFHCNVSNLPWLELTYPDLISNLLLLPQIDTVGAVTLTTPERTYRFEMSGEGDELKVVCDGIEVDTKAYRTFYQTLIGLPAEEYTTLQPQEGEAPVMSFSYSYRSGSPTDTVELYKGPTLQVFMSINGETEFLTKEKYLDTIRQNAQNLLEGKEVMPLY